MFTDQFHIRLRQVNISFFKNVAIFMYKHSNNYDLKIAVVFISLSHVTNTIEANMSLVKLTHA